MSKRRRRKKSAAPNIPQETLERARQQAGLESETEDTETDSSSEDTPATVADVMESRSSRRSRRRRKSQNSIDAKRRDPEALDSVFIAEALANPTRSVTQEQMREEYGYVLKDLRSMGILAAVLFVALVLMAQML